jgi:hypothetical protein
MEGFSGPGAWVLMGLTLVALGGGLAALFFRMFVLAIPLAFGAAALAMVPIFFAQSVAPLHQAFDEFLGRPHEPAPFEDVRSWAEAAGRLRQVLADLSAPELASAEGTLRVPDRHSVLDRMQQPQMFALVLFLSAFLALFSLYKLFRLAMAYAGCGLPWGGRARVEVGGMEFRFRLDYPMLEAGDMAYDLSDAQRHPDNPYQYQLTTGTVLRFFKVPRRHWWQI